MVKVTIKDKIIINGSTIVGQLGEGTFADVYKIRHNNDGEIMAAKVLRDKICDIEQSSYVDFHREYQLLQYLNIRDQPNIVHVYEFLHHYNRAVILMEYISGRTVGQYIKDNLGFVPIVDVFRLLSDISSALKYCHYDIGHDYININNDIYDRSVNSKCIEKNEVIFRIVHNDIYHSNILRRYDGSFVLIDFGFGFINDIANGIGDSRRTNGRPDFKPPEKWLSNSALSPTVDIYSFGVVLYEFLTGRLPFIFDKTKPEKIALDELKNAVIHNTPHPIYEYRKLAYENLFPDAKYEKDYPDWLENLIMKCLEKNPQDRFADGNELYNYIQQRSTR